MRNKNYKGRCEKRTLSKANGILKTYDAVQSAYADILQSDANIKEIQCNINLDGPDAEEYTSDFVCIKTSGDLAVRECVYRKLLTKPRTSKLLDISREYWFRRGVVDWGIVIDEEK